MNGECNNCGIIGDMKIYDCGLKFCSFKCQKEYRYRPNMTDENFEWDTTIDEIELDGGKEYLYLRSVDQFYHLYSGYKVIVTDERVFHHEQLCGFTTVKNARESWNKLKTEKNLQSWADLQPSLLEVA